jgi:hypothetical protein
MVAIYTGSFPFDPETELRNFEREQAKFEAAYRRTGEPLALYETLLHATAAKQLTPRWLVEALGKVILQGRTDQTAERFRERMRHVQRYRCVRDLRQKGHIKDCALDLAVTALEGTDAAGARPTIEHSYDLVRRDLKRTEQESEYFYLVARADPAVVPVSVTRRSDGATVINGVALQSSGVIVRETIRGADRSGNDQGG